MKTAIHNRIYHWITWPASVEFDLKRALKTVGFSGAEAGRLVRPKITRRLPGITAIKLGPHSALIVLPGDQITAISEDEAIPYLPEPFVSMEVVERAEKLWEWVFQGREP